MLSCNLPFSLTILKYVSHQNIQGHPPEMAAVSVHTVTLEVGIGWRPVYHYY